MCKFNKKSAEKLIFALQMSEMQQKKTVTGVYGGSFNPIHLGHTMMAEDLVSCGVVDEVWFVVSPQNPLKDSGLWDDEFRLRLARIAVDGKKMMMVSDVEFGMPKPNYMANTLAVLAEQNPEREFVLIIGMDNWQTFDKWYRWQDIIRDYGILVLPRVGASPEDRSTKTGSQPLMQVSGDHLEKVNATPLPLRNISSTWIRRQIATNPEYNGQWLAPNVWNEIKRMKA